MIKVLTTKMGFGKRKGYSDAEVIGELQQRSRTMEEWFYRETKRYFDEKFNRVFFDKDRKQEIFQCAFLKLWTEIDNRRICVTDDTVCRQQSDGVYRPLTCTLLTFLMAFAHNEYRELVRSDKEEYVGELFEEKQAELTELSYEQSEEEEEQKNRIVDECILQLPPRCVEILTLFYHEGKSLDEIMELRKEKNSSKNGLKSAKNKCMTTLRERVAAEMKRYHLAV